MDIEGIIASKKEARKKAKKVRFHQRECAVSEPSEGTVVFPAPSKGKSESDWVSPSAMMADTLV